MRRAGEIQGRVEASQKGRAAMDTITRQLRSQVCLSSTVPPMAAATATQRHFYADLTDGDAGMPPELHTITYDPASRTLIEQRDFVGTGHRAGDHLPRRAEPHQDAARGRRALPSAGRPQDRRSSATTRSTRRRRRGPTSRWRPR